MNYKKKLGFTLVELIVGIAIIGIIALGISNLFSNNITEKQKLNLFSNKIIGIFSTIKNYALIGKGIGTNLETPIYFKIEFSTGNYLKTYFNTGGLDIIYNDLSITTFENYYKINSIECKNSDLSNITSINLAQIIYEGANISFSGCNDNYQKIIDLELIYKNNYKNKIRLNAISGVIEVIKE